MSKSVSVSTCAGKLPSSTFTSSILSGPRRQRTAERIEGETLERALTAREEETGREGSGFGEKMAAEVVWGVERVVVAISY